MESVTCGVRELQAKLGEVLRAVEYGKRVYVASRKKIVAMITRPDAVTAASAVTRRPEGLRRR